MQNPPLPGLSMRGIPLRTAEKTSTGTQSVYQTCQNGKLCLEGEIALAVAIWHALGQIPLKRSLSDQGHRDAIGRSGDDKQIKNTIIHKLIYPLTADLETLSDIRNGIPGHVRELGRPGMGRHQL